MRPPPASVVTRSVKMLTGRGSRGRSGPISQTSFLHDARDTTSSAEVAKISREMISHAVSAFLSLAILVELAAGPAVSCFFGRC
jgi:hypothetical protein